MLQYQCCSTSAAAELDPRSGAAALRCDGTKCLVRCCSTNAAVLQHCIQCKHCWACDMHNLCRNILYFCVFCLHFKKIFYYNIASIFRLNVVYYLLKLIYTVVQLYSAPRLRTILIFILIPPTLTLSMRSLAVALYDSHHWLKRELNRVDFLIQGFI